MNRYGYAVLAEGLHKRYGDKTALADFDLAVEPGTVQGMLGPNGAGKTTALRIFTTLARPSGGRAEVAGFDVSAQPRQVRRRIGLTGQHTTVDTMLTGRQNLALFGRLFHLGAARARLRAGELLERFGLADDADKDVKDYSGGMRRRLDLAASMILAPRVLFLDEPTTGLDPRGRNEVWEAVRSLVAGGTTVLLTTQYLDEADRLADRVAVVDRGRKIADDTPDGLKRAVGGDQVEVVVRDAADVPAAVRAVARVARVVWTAGGTAGAEPRTDGEARRVSAPVEDRMAALTEVARTLRDQGVEVEDLGLRRPTLDEVFLRLTGHEAGRDGGRDAGPDGGHEAGPDGGRDGGYDAGHGGGRDGDAGRDGVPAGEAAA